MSAFEEIETLLHRVRSNHRASLARAITLIESRAPKHSKFAEALIEAALPFTGGAIRIGITGVPGAGKSTFTEALGMYLCGLGKKVAVLAVDPTSSIHGGSILGDKTRMEGLSREKNAFIRPSPSGTTPGGVAARTREAMLLCEAAGYEVIIVETVGVGQGETEVRTMTDCFLLLQITGAGDGLQAIKKGVLELVDAIIINKADGANTVRAQQACGEYARMLEVLQPFTEGWQPQALTCSALEKKGVDAVWELIEAFEVNTQKSGVFERRRQTQNLDWFQARLKQSVMEAFRQREVARLPKIEAAVSNGELSVAGALKKMLAKEDRF